MIVLLQCERCPEKAVVSVPAFRDLCLGDWCVEFEGDPLRTIYVCPKCSAASAGAADHSNEATPASPSHGSPKEHGAVLRRQPGSGATAGEMPPNNESEE